jgi:Ca2+-binding EF-hand superfamily protein
MRTTRLPIPALGAGLALGLAAVSALADDGRGSRGAGGHGLTLLETFDTDRDGRLTQAEIDAVRTARFAEFDKDGDGKLSLEEYQLLWVEAMRPRMVRQFQGHDRDGDGAITQEEFLERYRLLVYRLDADNDGVLTREELRPRRGGRRGGG